MTGAAQHSERILLIGDSHRLVAPALAQALPGAQVVAIDTVFDALAELSAGTFTAVVTGAEPIEQRPESAVRALRDLAGNSRLLLFGHSALEPMSRRMLQFGADDYLITPAAPAELQQIFGTAPRRRTTPVAAQAGAEAPSPPRSSSLAHSGPGAAAPAPADQAAAAPATLDSLPLDEILLDALLHQPGDATETAIRCISAAMAPGMRLVRARSGAADPQEPDLAVYEHPVHGGSDEPFSVQLQVRSIHDPADARHLLGRVAFLLGKVVALQDRHARLQRLAITDDLTGLYNGRYFRHFLQRVIDTARHRHFPVTLLLFDIDNFKQYNDTYGHGVGDEILKQTASLMRQCVREHDLVARISGDEFAVVFWEKGGPRQPQGPNPGIPGRPPQTPLQVFQRFQRLLTTQHFSFLGPSGQGRLTISGGLAVFPWDANDPDELIAAADKQLMFGAKRAGKNAIFLVGGASESSSSSDA